MNITKSFIACFLVLNVAACTWVELSPQGENVRVLATNEVTSCEHVGKTTAVTAAKLAGFERHADKVQTELNTLARNSAIEIGGDTVVAVDRPVEGRQVFEVYRCMP